MPPASGLRVSKNKSCVLFCSVLHISVIEPLFLFLFLGEVHFLYQNSFKQLTIRKHLLVLVEVLYHVKTITILFGAGNPSQ